MEKEAEELRKDANIILIDGRSDSPLSQRPPHDNEPQELPGTWESAAHSRACSYIDASNSANLPRSFRVIPRARITAALTPSSIMACRKSVTCMFRPSTESLAPIERMLRVAETMPIKRNGRKEVACVCK